LKTIVSIREDYIRDDSDEDSWIFNPNWKILPSITFVKGKGPLVLTCKEHNGGTKQSMVHPCHWQHNLPSRRPDQLCQAVVQPHILRPVNASWKEKRDRLIRNGVNSLKAWAYSGFEIISELNEENFGVKPSDLTLVCLFKE
jgi:hypothetical protein